ncbi:hypothetical protein F5878DRAFT_409703 [Lentinula raphanica]|uniref:Uncharacterized protein n=1 Tax=Lentinula raphanica TaxID=153919 RepID=A0AA38PGE4_9AGAR|nr:hypothetical protein F5878DRAFT_409703 [Lentinula raphanica]
MVVSTTILIFSLIPVPLEIHLQLHMASETLGLFHLANQISSSRLKLFHAAAICCGTNGIRMSVSSRCELHRGLPFGWCACTQIIRRRFRAEGSTFFLVRWLFVVEHINPCIFNQRFRPLSHIRT